MPLLKNKNFSTNLVSPLLINNSMIAGHQIAARSECDGLLVNENSQGTTQQLPLLAKKVSLIQEEESVGNQSIVTPGFRIRQVTKRESNDVVSQESFSKRGQFLNRCMAGSSFSTLNPKVSFFIYI